MGCVTVIVGLVRWALAQHAEATDLGMVVAAFDAVDRTLAGAQQLGELVLGETTVLAGVADEIADPAFVSLSHGGHGISDMR